jgi:hypothetical protein
VRLRWACCPWCCGRDNHRHQPQVVGPAVHNLSLTKSAYLADGSRGTAAGAMRWRSSIPPALAPAPGRGSRPGVVRPWAAAPGRGIPWSLCSCWGQVLQVCMSACVCVCACVLWCQCTWPVAECGRTSMWPEEQEEGVSRW